MLEIDATFLMRGSTLYLPHSAVCVCNAVAMYAGRHFHTHHGVKSEPHIVELFYLLQNCGNKSWVLMRSL